MNPIEDSYIFLNSFLIDKSINTRYIYMNALKALYCFEEIMGMKLVDFSPTEIQALKDFLRGICRPSSSLLFRNLSERSAETVNQFLGVYRLYLEFKNTENKYLLAKKNSKTRVRINEDFGYAAFGKYKANVNTKVKDEVPRYISLEEYVSIIRLIRRKYTIREECMVRLMYETGMRIGEVLGLTNEDVVCQKIGQKYCNCVYIRNRMTDKRYQFAKTVMKITSTKDYETQAYKQLDVGYQMVFITDELYEMIGDYIDHAHEAARKRYINRYKKTTIADSVCGHSDNFYIFTNSYGGNLSNVSWNKLLRNIFEEVNIQVDEKIRDNNLSHRFRHGFAMFQIQYRNVKALELAEMMRHKSVSSVMKYYRPTISDKIKLKEEYTEDLYNLVPELKEIQHAHEDAF